MAVGSRSVLTEIRNLQDATNSMKNGVVEMNIGAEKNSFFWELSCRDFLKGKAFDWRNRHTSGPFKV